MFIKKVVKTKNNSALLNCQLVDLKRLELLLLNKDNYTIKQFNDEIDNIKFGTWLHTEAFHNMIDNVNNLIFLKVDESYINYIKLEILRIEKEIKNLISICNLIK